MLRRIFGLTFATVVALTITAAAAGEPSWKTEGITLTCTQNGETLGTATFSGGSGPNQSPIAFVGDASFGTPNSIFVQVLITLTVGDETFTALEKPFPAQKNLITCTGGGEGFSISTTRIPDARSN